MDEVALFKALKKQTKATLLELLHSAYVNASDQQRRYIFGSFVKSLRPPKLPAKDVLKESKTFYEDSLAGLYYAPFNINSKNFSHIPDETEEWFAKLGDLLQDSAQLVKQEDYSLAVASFEILYELIEKMENGEEIIFADEYGSWMIPGNEKAFLEAYISSLANVRSPEDYAQDTIPLIERDSYSSFCHKVYAMAVKYGDPEQKKCLKAEIKKQNIRTKSAR